MSDRLSLLASHHANGVIDESPFYLARQTSDHPPLSIRSQNGESFGQRPRDDTENDELRDVIDDLTVENKKLKNVLRNWQSRSSPATSNPDRIFELRTYGLSAEKKRELEDLLRKFATSLTGEPSSQPSSTAPVEKSASSAVHAPALARKPHHGHDNTDSGYASIANSGMNSTSHSSSLNNIRDHEPLSKSKKNTDIKNYLHDIPDSLLPRESVSVSEDVKMQLVVQRLEQLFTGKHAGSGEHSLPVQQQRISRSAAKADRREDEKQNRTHKTEGSREAHILHPDSQLNFDTLEASGPRPGSQSTPDLSSTEGNGTKSAERPGSPDQRPTRPLDLDVHRAQVAEDNIEYIRHLGLPSPQVEDHVDAKGQPWLFLNLLVSMAQLHTLSVTPSFVRKAVKQLSTKFELSNDGHKIRWMGDDASDGFCGQESPEHAAQHISDDTGDDGGRRSGQSTASTLNNASVSISEDKIFPGMLSHSSSLVHSTSASSNPARHQASTSQSKSTSAFEYKPIVLKGQKTFLAVNNSYLDSSSSNDGLSPESNGLAHALSRSNLKSRDDGYEGYITFFNNPSFVADLSGDKSHKTVHTGGYSGVGGVLGISNENHLHTDDSLRDARACYFLSPLPPERNGWPQDGPQIEMLNAPIDFAGEDETLPMELEASGLGGVRPEDNFALDVQVARKQQRPDNGHRKRRIGDKVPARYAYQVSSCRRLSLQPSRLPPPSYLFFRTSSSSEAEEGHFYDEDGSETSSEAENSPVPAGLLWQWSMSSNERQAGEDDGSVASSSLGVLQAGRARIPQTINEAGEPVSGSLAATVGASWSAASSAAAPDVREAEEESMSSMSVEREL